MDKPIPDEIWEAARSLRNAVNWQSNASVEIIARALMARDERAAGIAREASDECDGDEGWITGTAIATAILTFDGASNAE